MGRITPIHHWMVRTGLAQNTVEMAVNATTQPSGHWMVRTGLAQNTVEMAVNATTQPSGP
jgi:hypothetical protein